MPGESQPESANGGHGNDRPTCCPYPNKKGVLADALSYPPILETLYSNPRPYWQASQVPPLRMASMEHAFFSSAVYSFFSAFGAFSTVAFSMLEAPRVRR